MRRIGEANVLRQRWVMLLAAAVTCSGFLSGAIVMAAPGAAAALVAASSGTWGPAEQVPGSSLLNQGGRADIASVSCASAGNCSAGGLYASGTGATGKPVTQALVVTETGGVWHSGREVPGLAALDRGSPGAEVLSVSCATAGNCSAGGEYTTGTAATEAFVASQNGGTWGTAHEIRGIGVLNQTGLAVVSSVACATPGNCSAAGSYHDASFTSQAFAVDRSGGTWGTAQEVPGTASLDQGSSGAVAASVSCGAAGDCSLGGYYTDASGRKQAFVASETAGTWNTAQEVPGTAALNAGGAGGTHSVSCASAGNCSAGGHYTTTQSQQAFVVNETGSP